MTDAETMSRVSKALDAFKIEIPSWGFANTGTRFGKFVQQGAATTIEEKFADAGMVHRGYVVRAPDGTYRNAVQPNKLKFGFAGRSKA